MAAPRSKQFFQELKDKLKKSKDSSSDFSSSFSSSSSSAYNTASSNSSSSNTPDNISPPVKKAKPVEPGYSLLNSISTSMPTSNNSIPPAVIQSSLEEVNIKKEKQEEEEVEEKQHEVDALEKFSPPNSPVYKKISDEEKLKKELTELLEEAKKIEKRLGIMKSGTKEEFNPPEEKIMEILRLLTLWARIEKIAALTGSDFSVKIMSKLQKFYFWLLSPENFTDKDRALLGNLATDRNKEIHLVKMLKTLQNMIEKHYTPLMLKNMMYSFRSLGILHQSKSFNKKPISTDISSLKKDVAKALRKKNKVLNEETLDNKLLNLERQIDKCRYNYHDLKRAIKIEKSQEEVSKKLIKAAAKGSSTFFGSPKLSEKISEYDAEILANKEKAANSAYYYSEEAIRTATTILNSPLKMDNKTEMKLHQIIANHLDINQDAFNKSETLKTALEKEQQEYQLALDIRDGLELDKISAKVVNTDSNPDKLEEKLIIEKLQNIKHRKLEWSVHGGLGGDDHNKVYIITDTEKNIAVVVRGKGMTKEEAKKGCTPDQLSLRVTNSLGNSVTTPKYFIVGGAIIPYTAHTDPTYRNYEISKAIVGSTSLLDHFVKKHGEKDVVNFQLDYIDMFLQTANYYRHIARPGVYSGDFKPGNGLLEQRAKNSKEFQEEQIDIGKLRVSDEKGYETFLPERLPNHYFKVYPTVTAEFHTNEIVVKTEEGNVYDLLTLSRQTLAYTLLQLISLAELKSSLKATPKEQYEQFADLLDEKASAKTFINPDTKEKTTAIQIKDLYDGPLGEDIKEIAKWITDLAKCDPNSDKDPRVVYKQKLDYIIDDYFARPEVRARIEKEKELRKEKTKGAVNEKDNNYMSPETEKKNTGTKDSLGRRH